jgi:alpha-tubulin suppressor-like RCC1 family protein
MGGTSILRRAALAAVPAAALYFGCADLAGLNESFKPRPDAGGVGGAGAGGAASTTTSSSSTGGSESANGGSGGQVTCPQGQQGGGGAGLGCGGPDLVHCPRCPPGTDCSASSDCASNDCEGGACRKIVAVAAGADHTCALSETGLVRCWGSNAALQLGTSQVAGQTEVPQVVGVTASLISAGADFNCAQPTGGGSIRCWGNNKNLELGASHAVGGMQSATPIDTMTSGSLFFDSAGAAFVCVVETATGAACWGSDSKSQLGDDVVGGNQKSPVAVASVAGKTVIAIASGTTHACGLVGGSAYCWGDSDHGRLGAGEGNPTGSELVDLTAGDAHTCAREMDGSVVCWGDNTYDQIGDPSIAFNSSPHQVGSLTDVTRISAGLNHTCAVTGTPPSTHVLCWGGNTNAALGQPTQGPSGVTKTAQPVEVKKLHHDIVAISAGGNHTCVVSAEGAVFCWGENDDDELGVSGGTSRVHPVEVTF